MAGRREPCYRDSAEHGLPAGVLRVVPAQGAPFPVLMPGPARDGRGQWSQQGFCVDWGQQGAEEVKDAEEAPYLRVRALETVERT